jgi:hypothetical protein
MKDWHNEHSTIRHEWKWHNQSSHECEKSM